MPHKARTLTGEIDDLLRHQASLNDQALIKAFAVRVEQRLNRIDGDAKRSRPPSQGMGDSPER